MLEGNKSDWIASNAGVVLVGGHCSECGRKFFPMKRHCPGCGGGKVLEVELSRKGRLYSYSTIHSAPRGFRVPYTVGFVDLEDGVRVFGQIEGGEAGLALDESMEPVVGVIRTTDEGEVEGYKFRRTDRVA